MARLFVAVVPPDEVLDVVEHLDRPEERGVRYTRRDQWHVTLRFLGEADQADAVAALSRLDAEPTEAQLGPDVSRLGRNVAVVAVTGLDDLATAVRDVTATVGRPPDPRPFNGHLTIARLRNRPACRVAGQRLSARFDVGSVELIRSNLDAAGARYTTVVVQPLEATRTGSGR